LTTSDRKSKVFNDEETMGRSRQCQTAFQTNFQDLHSKEATLFMGSIQLGGIFSKAADMQVKTPTHCLLVSSIKLLSNMMCIGNFIFEFVFNFVYKS